MVIRHGVLFVLADGTTEDQVIRAKEGMALCYFGSEVLALDFGSDLGAGESTNYGLGLVHDHRDRAAWDKYNENDVHHRVGEYIKTITQPGRVARVDWEYDGPASTRGTIRHIAMYRWRDEASANDKQAVKEALSALPGACPTVRYLVVADDLGWYPQGPNYDWVVEAHFDDVDGLKAFLDHRAQRDAAALVAASTKPGDPAQLQHRMMAG